MFGSSDNQIKTFTDLKIALIGKPPIQLAEYIQYSHFVNSIERLKEIYPKNPKFGQMLLELKEVRALFKKR